MSSHLVCLRDAGCHLRLKLHDIRDGTLLKVRIWPQLHHAELAVHVMSQTHILLYLYFQQLCTLLLETSRN